MKLRTLVITIVLTASAALAEVAPNLVVQGVPEIPRELAEGVAPYLEFRTASHSDWHPTKREILISTRFGDTAQLHHVKMPGGARRQLTFFPDRVGGGSFSPANENVVVFSKDIGGAEFFQLYRFDRGSGAVALLTDGKSRNSGGRWSNDGKRIAYSSTRRNGQDTDIYIMNVMEPKTDRLLVELKGGGWQAGDWSPDDQKLVVTEGISVNESYLYLVDVENGTMRLLTPKGGEKISFSQPSFSTEGQSIYLISDEGSEFSQLVRMNLESGAKKVLTASARADVDEFELSEDGKTIAYTTNEQGIGVLHLFNVNSGKELAAPKLPLGTVYGLDWHRNSRDLAFNLVSAKSTQDVFSLDLKTGKVERWTESETGGLDPSRNAEPELVTMKSFDGTTISGFIYRPDPAKFPGKRPVMINIHGGPEGQFQPGFLGRGNYLINELGMAILYPNVRGSSGYGKTFLTMDNGMKREDSVRDIGTFIQWIKSDRSLDGDRIGVAGGSYGGYMTLAVMTHYSDQLRAAVDVVGISNFVTFLRNTQGYRRDLRRGEYGDERDETMRAFLEKISPLTNAAKIKKPLFVVQGFNDPRVPYTEAEQIVKAVRDNSVAVWYLMAKDEGHGFAKKANADYQFMATILFWQEHLLGR